MAKINLAHFVDWKKVADTELDSVFSELSDMGVGNIVIHPYWWQCDPDNGTFLAMIRRKMFDYGIVGTACHGLWGVDYDLNCPDEERRGQIVAAHRSFMKAVADMGSLTYTVHLGRRYSEHPDEYINIQTIKSIDELLPTAERAGIKIAMENMVNYDHGADIAKLAAAYDHPSLGLCLDTGHAHIKEGLRNAVTCMESYLFTCHMQDNDGSGDQHYPPGYGTIDWDYLIPALQACPALVNAETEAGPCKNLSRQEIWKLFKTTWEKTYTL